MEKLLVKKNELAGIAEKIAGETNLYAPVKDEDNVLFTLLKGTKCELEGYKNTKNAPKGFFFPRSETLMRYKRTDKGMELADVVNESGPAVLFGVRPCDARSFALLDMLFDQESYRDPYYIDKRNNTTVVALACVHPPYSTCFCTSVGGSPASTDGVDVMLTDLGDAYLAEFLTDKGAKLAKYFGSVKADAASDTKKSELAASAAKEIKSAVPAKEIKKFLDENFEHPFWETLHKKCLACGTCTFLCPTCHCFDIQDEVKDADGKRLRNWDSCMFPLFTKETSGHNPRPSQKERWRQRVMHKFRYYVDNFNAIACVGCGRCVMYCPVNMDIRKIVEDISKL
ncbi:MAG TPA: 4Fe-4S dicluster domain-containing protein [Deltaproteobacteria bacterium]|nr:4Fe-4S dicluster domain-containing protein [Deltaproteobacteria bacterium]HPR55306.1 4Fe-4S dicluster domain-containing protein [Deltaproteobacteria bacterium]HXK48481.1 4Fe-4S dicluster domain-containing protein [Deltaproteobacteria bacterium]